MQTPDSNAGHSDRLADLVAKQSIQIPVAGSSMWPCLRAGDVLDVSPRTTRPVVGQIAIAVLRGALVAHRVIAVDEAGVVLQGDNAPCPDPTFRHVEVLGVVTSATSSRGRQLPLFQEGFLWLAYSHALPAIRATRRTLASATRPLRAAFTNRSC